MLVSGALGARTKPAGFEDGANAYILRAVATGSLIAGTVHASVCREHFHEWVVYGVFFVLISFLQFAWAMAVALRPDRRLLVAGGAGMLLTVAVWTVSRTTGVPFGPKPWVPEAPGVTDVLATAVEVVVAGLALLLVARMGQSRSRIQLPAWSDLWAKARSVLPRGGALPEKVWADRHRWILRLLWAHAPFLFLAALLLNEPGWDIALEMTGVVGLALAAQLTVRFRRLTTVLTSIGLLTCSAVMVHLSHGMIEMHFHYFVMVGVITLYQDWWPFLIAIGYVVLQHGLAGALDPRAVYNHEEAIQHPWEWAMIHGVFILGMSCAGIASWRLNEAFLTGVVDRQEKLTEAQHVARLGSWERDLVNGSTTWSDEFYRLVDLDPETTAAGPDSFFERVHREDRDHLLAGTRDTALNGVPLAIDVRLVVGDGSIRWLHVRSNPKFGPDGTTVVAVAGTVQEITDRKEAEAEVTQAVSLLTATLDATADGLLVVGTDGGITSFNRRFVEMWHIPTDILERRDDDEALGYVVSQLAHPEAFLQKVRDLYAEPEADSEDVIDFIDGRIFERFSTPQRVGGEVVGRVWSFRDVTQRKRLEDELAHQAFHDSLTGLANQALFRDRVGHALLRVGRDSSTLAVLFLDLDDFKTVNDSLGHTAGDELLRSVAARLRSCLRATDTAARLGGDEFAVLIEECRPGEAEALAGRILDVLRQPTRLVGQEVFVSASIGIALTSGGATTDQLLRNADLAMYRAKRDGKNRFEIYQATMHQAAIERLQLEADLRRGLAAHQLVLQYQPIIELATGSVTGTEALVRWQHPTRGLLTPDVFIGLAEETGLICDLGTQVLHEACRQTKAWQTDHPDYEAMSVSVNVSARQLVDDELIGQVRSALETSGLAPASLVLELTETAIMSDTNATVAQLHQLKALGVRLAVDDFGTGYSSLSYLHRFPIDIVKIDRTFVGNIDTPGDEASLVRAIVNLAQSLRLKTVAEGVETEVQAYALNSFGCDLAQGYLYSQPVTPDAIRDLFLRGAALELLGPNF